MLAERPRLLCWQESRAGWAMTMLRTWFLSRWTSGSQPLVMPA